MRSEADNQKEKMNPFMVYLIPIMAAAVLKIWLILSGSLPFNADEAVVALMAKHINQGEIPRFFYGQAYLGSLDAILVALGFRVFGEQVWVIRLVQSLLYLGTVYTTIILAGMVLKSRKAALFSGLLTAVPPVNVSLYTTVSLGGYGEALLFGNLLIITGIKLINAVKKVEFIAKWNDLLALFLWGIGAGFSIWVFGLALVYVIPVLIYILKELRLIRNIRGVILGGLLILTGGVVGSSPWWTYGFQENWQALFSELIGGALAGTQSASGLFEVVARLGYFIVLGGSVTIGLRPPWSVQWLMLPILPFALLFWLAVLVHITGKFRKTKAQAGLSMVFMVGIILVLGFLFTPFGGDPSGRYFLPLILPLAIFGGDFVSNRLNGKALLQIGCLVFIIFFNLGGTIQSALNNPPGLTTQFDDVAQIKQEKMNELIAFLKSQNELRGYSNYWVSYPLAFLSSEELIFIPRLPYHEDFRYTARDDRYPPYRDQVEQASQIAYITTNHQELNKYLREHFKDSEMTWQEKTIGDFQIFYDLSRVVRPQDIGLGTTTNP